MFKKIVDCSDKEVVMKIRFYSKEVRLPLDRQLAPHTKSAIWVSLL
jgi:hypothetical protein